jgi:predicted transcriptional regulator
MTSTGISRSVLLALQDGPLPVVQILDALGPRGEGVHEGTVWTILARARQNGLVTRKKDGRTYFYSLTDGGVRRVEWLLKKKTKVMKVAANPKEKDEV